MIMLNDSGTEQSSRMRDAGCGVSTPRGHRWRGIVRTVPWEGSRETQGNSEAT